MFVCLLAFPRSDSPLVTFRFGNHSVQYAVEAWVVSLPLEPTRVLSRLGCEAGAAGGKLSFWWSPLFSTAALEVTHLKVS